tara:strand:- start:392 stop:574 length:183 start_codon:yes stop_codon:yes gene_type:complete
MTELLKAKVELEHLWVNMYEKNGVYTNEMVYLDKAISNLKKKIIVHDQEQVKKRYHNYIK